MRSIGLRARLTPNRGTLYSLPLLLWFTAFFVVPLAMILLFSFLKADIDGGVKPIPSMSAYLSLLTPRIARIFWTTLWVSGLSTVITVAAALPCAYFIARSRAKNFLLILVIIPFWTNFIIRVFAWKSILESNGVINSLLMGLRIIQHPLPLEHNWVSVIIINVYTYLTYAILPLYSTIEKFDFTLLEAAGDLGANKLRSIFNVLLPNVSAGLTTAVLFTFIPLLGTFAVPQLIGTKQMYLIGNEINDSIYKYFDWPAAYALGVGLMLLTNVGLMYMLYSENRAKRRLAT